MATSAAEPLPAGTLSAGVPPEGAAATLILVHRRGASAGSMLPLAAELGVERLAVLAPQAKGSTWYPQSFLAPLEANEPSLGAALQQLESVVRHLLARGAPAERIALLGFSQGACLTCEFTARHPRRYGAVIAFTGGLIGPPGAPRDYPGTLAGTAVFLGSGDPDPHVPFARVQETERVLAAMGAAVDLRRYPGMPHTINRDELDTARALLRRVAAAERP